MCLQEKRKIGRTKKDEEKDRGNGKLKMGIWAKRS